MPDFHQGWFQVAFMRDVPPGLSPAAIGSRRLVLLREADRVRAFDADCPHRGADLALGTLQNGNIRCAFHGYVIGLSDGETCRFRAVEHRVLTYGELVLVCLFDHHDNGLNELLADLDREYVLVPALRLKARVDAAIVIENAFDRMHFSAVHGLKTDAFAVRRDPGHGLRVSSTFYVRYRSASDGKLLSGMSHVSYEATAVSPGLVLVKLGGPHPYAAITGALDGADGVADIRLTFALPRSTYGDAPDPARYAQLIAYSEQGLKEDCRVWESLSPVLSPLWTDDDEPIRAFRRYTEEFQ